MSSAFTKTFSKVKESTSRLVRVAHMRLYKMHQLRRHQQHRDHDGVHLITQNRAIDVVSLVIDAPEGPWASPSDVPAQVLKNERVNSTEPIATRSSYMANEDEEIDNYRAPNKGQKFASTLSRVCRGHVCTAFCIARWLPV